MSSAELQPVSLGALFLLGLLGSGHCVGMCGPLIVAFPARAGRPGAQLIYHLGRLLTYGAVGVVLGAIGAGIARVGPDASLVWTARIQLALSVIAALAMILFGLSKLGLIREPELLRLANPARIPGFGRLRHYLGSPERDDQRPSLPSLFLLGLLLGLLPCGLSFAAFARALGASGPLQGGLLTLAFGLGTLPSLLLVGAGASRLSAQHRRASDIIAGMLIMGMAVALIVNALGALG